MVLSNSATQASSLKPQAIPAHVAVIMDGNGRWAKARGLPRTAGHKKGADALRRTLDNCKEAGIKHLTVYAFSSENWKRPDDEVNDLMQLLRHYLKNELSNLIKNNIRLIFMGNFERLPEDVCEQVADAMEKTLPGQFTLTIALSYGGRQEIAMAAQKMAKMVKSGAIEINDIDESLMSDMLYTAGTPDPDLLIRTGGEKRLSNFLLWQSAYTEFYFCDTLWPDFDKKDLQSALADFAKRERRYGTS